MDHGPYSRMTYLGRHVLHRFPGFSYENLRDGDRNLFRVFERRMVTSYSWETLQIGEVSSLGEVEEFVRSSP